MRGLLLHDEDRRQVVQHQRVRLVGGQLDGVLVDHLLVDDRLGVDVELARAVLDGGRTVQRPDHVLGGQLGAVVELHALADLEFPGEVVDQLPGLSQAGDDAAVRVHLDQRVEHVLRHVDIGEQVVEVRIHRGRRRTHGQFEVRGLGGAGERQAKGPGYRHHTNCLLESAKGHRAILPVGSEADVLGSAMRARRGSRGRSRAGAAFWCALVIRLRSAKRQLPAGHFKHELFQQSTCDGNAGKPTAFGILHRAIRRMGHEPAHFGAFPGGIV
ncbi:hypothetical protein D3C72_1559460 [compost metagenome]